RRIRHGILDEAGQECVGVNHRQLSTRPRRFHIHALRLEAWAKGVPVGERWHQDDALSVRESSAGEPADGAVEKILVLIELHDVVAWGGVRHHSIPGLTHAVRFMVKLTVHRNCLRSMSAGPPQYPWGDANSLSIILWCRSASCVRSRVRAASYKLFRPSPGRS